MGPAAGWMIVWVLIAGGLLGTVLPALPGTLLVLAGIVLGAWLDDFSRVGVGVVAAEVVLAVLAWALDYAAGLMGARRAGASRLALVGAFAGTVLGLLMGLVGVLFMPLVGAAAGEWWARRDEAQTARQALRVGIATWLGMIAGLLAKVVISCVMVGIFIASYLV